MGTRERESSILIVDDDAISIRLLRRALQAYADVRVATDGDGALLVARHRTPDIVLLDAQMPRVDGFEVCRDMQADPVLRDVPILFVTSHKDLEFERQAFEVGARDFLPKPIVESRVQLRVGLHLQARQQTRHLTRLASSDYLTGLANRRMVDDRLVQEWERAQRSGKPLSLLLIDVDWFRRYNDRYGHGAGDACLQLVAQDIQAAAEQPDAVAGRFGGEEFVVILPGTDFADAIEVAEKVRNNVAARAIAHDGSGERDILTVSIGVASSDGLELSQASAPGTAADQPSEQDLIAAADRALYLAKAGGRDQVAVLFDDTIAAA